MSAMANSRGSARPEMARVERERAVMVAVLICIIVAWARAGDDARLIQPIVAMLSELPQVHGTGPHQHVLVQTVPVASAPKLPAASASALVAALTSQDPGSRSSVTSRPSAPSVEPAAPVSTTREQLRWEELEAKYTGVGAQDRQDEKRIFLVDIVPPKMLCPQQKRIGHNSSRAATVCDLQALTHGGEKCNVISISDSLDHSFEVDLVQQTPCSVSLYGNLRQHRGWRDCGSLSLHRGGITDVAGLVSKAKRVPLLNLECDPCEWSDLNSLLKQSPLDRVDSLVLLLRLQDPQAIFSAGGAAGIQAVFLVFATLKLAGLLPYSWNVRDRGSGRWAVEAGFTRPRRLDSGIEPVAHALCPPPLTWEWPKEDRERRMGLSMCRSKDENGNWVFKVGERHAGHDSAILMLLPPYTQENKTYPWDMGDPQHDLDFFFRAVKTLKMLQDGNRAELRIVHDERDKWPANELKALLKLGGERAGCAIATQLARFPPGYSDASRSPFSRRSKWGYVHMCRFFFIDIFESDLLHGFKYWMRMDGDAHMVAPIPLSPWKWLDAHPDVHYLHYEENEDCGQFQAGLGELTTDFAAIFNMPAPVAVTAAPPNCVKGYYNNLEFGRLTAFMTPSMREWRWAVERSKGIYKWRWGDALLRRLSVELTGTKVAKIPKEIWEPYHHKW